MTNYKTTITIDKDKADFYEKFSEITGEQSAKLGEHYDNMYSEVAHFDNGMKAIISLVIADYDNYNYTIGTLVDTNDREISECIGEVMFGEWFFQMPNTCDDTYTVMVERK